MKTLTRPRASDGDWLGTRPRASDGDRAVMWSKSDRRSVGWKVCVFPVLLLSVVVTVTLKPFGCCCGNPVLFLEPVMKRRSEEDEEAEFLLPLAAP